MVGFEGVREGVVGYSSLVVGAAGWDGRIPVLQHHEARGKGRDVSTAVELHVREAQSSLNMTRGLELH